MILFSKLSDRIESRVFKELLRSINEIDGDLDVELLEMSGFSLKNIKKIYFSDVIIFQSAFINSFHLIMIAKILRKKTVGFCWDRYPVIVDGKRYDKRVKRIILDFFENMATRVIDDIIIPTEDFIESKNRSKMHVLGFWPKVRLNYNGGKRSDDILKIVFSGQINDTRGLVEAYEKIKAVCGSNFIFYIASHDKLPESFLEDERVIHVGYLSKSELKTLFQCCHFGLVSLTTKFEGPAFPSKSFDYIEAHLPIIYHGPDLESFKSIIIKSGVGVSLDAMDSVNFELHKKLLKDFAFNVAIFNVLCCLDHFQTKKFLQVIGKMEIEV